MDAIHLASATPLFRIVDADSGQVKPKNAAARTGSESKASAGRLTGRAVHAEQDSAISELARDTVRDLYDLL
jgi:hypothetical protein